MRIVVSDQFLRALEPYDHSQDELQLIDLFMDKP